MRRSFICLLPLLLLGCATGHYKIAKEEYRERVRTLGVVPLLVDESSTITHPERQKIVDLLRNQNAGKEERLMSMLRESKNYFDIRPVLGNPQQLLKRLVRGSTLRRTGAELYRRYQFDGRAAAEIASDSVVDALLIVIVNGVERTEKRRDRGPLLSYLETPYNPILVTATVVLPSGEIAWEYSGEPGEVFLHLQYPDFEEAFWNRTEEVRVKYISVPGLERTLTDTSGALFGREKFSRVHRRLFEEITAALHPGLLNPLRSKDWKPAAAPPAN